MYSAEYQGKELLTGIGNEGLIHKMNYFSALTVLNNGNKFSQYIRQYTLISVLINDLETKF